MITSLMPVPKQQYFGIAGIPLVGGKVFTYAAGTSTPKPTYTDSAGTIAQANPVILNARGEPVSPIYWSGSYKVVLQDALGNIVYTVDNYNTDPAGLLTFKSDLAAAAGSSLVGFVQEGFGAIKRWVLDKLRERVTLEDFGAVGDGVADDAPALIKAVTYVAAGRRKLCVLGKTYRLVPALARIDEAGANLAVVDMLSNLYIRADKGAIFKIADGISTDAAPVRMSMFFSNQVLHDISITGLTMDMNGANNRISPARPAAYNRFTQAAIIFSGTPGGQAARGTDIYIANNKFMNTSGVSCIVMSQSNTAGVALGKRWTLKDNLFNNNGTDTDDHSSVFGWADDVIVDGNTFTADVMFGTVSPAIGGFVAYETHGANQRFINNKVSNYFQGMWVGPNLTSDCDNIVIQGNTFSPVTGVAVDFFRFSAAESIIRKVLIEGNTVGLDDISIPNDLKCAFQIAAAYSISDVVIKNNLASKIGTGKASAFMNLVSQNTAAQPHKNIVIKDNYAIGFSVGVGITTTATNGMGYVEVSGNEFIDITPAGALTVSQGIALSGAGAVANLIIDGNSVIDTRAVPLAQYGIRLSGTVTKLNVRGNKYGGMTVSEYEESGLTVTTRAGDFDALAFSPVWSSGAPVTVGNGSVLGRYSVKGGQVTMNAILNVGSTTVFTVGNLAVALPVASAVPGLEYLGTWRIFDVSAGAFTFGHAVIDGTGSSAQLQVSGGLFANNSLPVALAAGDQIAMQITYNK